MDADDAGGLIRVAEWALDRFSERQLAAATGVVVLVYFRGEMRELVRSMFVRSSTRKRLETVEAAVAEATAKLERLEKLTKEQTPMLQHHGSQLDLVIKLLRGQDARSGG